MQEYVWDKVAEGREAAGMGGRGWEGSGEVSYHPVGRVGIVSDTTLTGSYTRTLTLRSHTDTPARVHRIKHT